MLGLSQHVVGLQAIKSIAASVIAYHRDGNIEAKGADSLWVASR
eukprot:SAG31_NODE_683_length_12836_cov_8.304938_10_plen_44_part_00